MDDLVSDLKKVGTGLKNLRIKMNEIWKKATKGKASSGNSKARKDARCEQDENLGPICESLKKIFAHLTSTYIVTDSLAFEITRVLILEASFNYSNYDLCTEHFRIHNKQQYDAFLKLSKSRKFMKALDEKYNRDESKIEFFSHLLTFSVLKASFRAAKDPAHDWIRSPPVYNDLIKVLRYTSKRLFTCEEKCYSFEKKGL